MEGKQNLVERKGVSLKKKKLLFRKDAIKREDTVERVRMGVRG